ncbi:MAG: FAD-linked oxidase C-terminal domain-containing protein [Actinomycetota bacterium]|jgi:glycolate oxidase
MSAADLATKLSNLVGSDVVRSDAVSLQAYSRDATPMFEGLPEVIVAPRNTAEVSKIVKFAHDTNTPIIARGAGSNLCAATVPLNGGIVMSMTKMNQVLEVSKSEMIAVVQPGVTNIDLDELVAKEGLRFIPDPGSRNVSTIGGNVATSAGGLRGLKYGTTRNYILGLEAVLGNGEIIRTGGRLVKDVAGYDVTRLLVGSEGTLAIFTEITVALAPRPEASKYGVAYFDDLASAAGAVEKIISSGILPATLEFLDNTCVVAVEDFAHLGLDTNAGALLLFGDDGDAVSIEQSVNKMAEIAKTASGARGVTLAADIAAADALLYARRCSLPALARLSSMSILEDIAVPRKAMAEVVNRIQDIGKKYGLRIGTFGHAGDGNLHPTIVLDKDNKDEVRAAEAALAEIFALPREFGGSITGEHGVGSAKLPYLEDLIGSTNMQLQRSIKKVFDPAGILNPGRIGS